MDPQTIISGIVSQLPHTYAAYAIGGWALAVTASNLILVGWKPPAVGSKWLLLYNVLLFISASKGYATPAFQPSASAIMVPDTMDKHFAAKAIGLDPATTDPKYPGAPQYTSTIVQPIRKA
jgi:hypothetical protein